MDAAQKIKRRARLAFIALLLFCVNPAFAQSGTARTSAAATVRVTPEATAHGEQLTLGDIADISAPDEAIISRLRQVSLGYAPDAGAVRELRRERLLAAIAAAGFTPDKVRIDAPPLVIIRRASQTVAREEFYSAAELALLPEISVGGVTARLSRLDLPATAVVVPAGRLEVRAQAASVRDTFAPFVVSLEIRVEGRIVRRLSATAIVEAHATIFVAARDLPAQARLRESDVRQEARRLERAPAAYLRDRARLRGLTTARAFRAGEAITLDATASIIVIRPGDAVSIIGESGPVRVAVAGEARGAGRVGDRILVKNTQSGTNLQAVVVDEGLVSVRF